MPTWLAGTSSSPAATGMNTGMATALIETTAGTRSVSSTGRATPGYGGEGKGVLETIIEKGSGKRGQAGFCHE